MKKRILNLLVASFLTSLLILTNPIYACTDFRLTAKDGSIIIARSMEFGINLESNLRSSPRERAFSTTTPDSKPGMNWKSTYGYLYLDGLNLDYTVDGLNEQGLSFEALYLPGETQYQNVPAGQEARAIPYYLFGDWILGNFKNVDEVRQALSNVYVFAQQIPGFKNVIFPLHGSIHDASGKSLVIEFVKGQMHVYDNTVGILTNSPTFGWQITNLRNYLNLSPYAPNPVVVDEITFATTGQGSGMFGLPGDYSPPSRFVKMAVLLKNVTQPVDTPTAVTLAEHIINNVDVPLGAIRIKQNGTDSFEITQWVAIKDLTHKVFYYRTYDNLTLHAVDMAKIDFSPNAPLLKMPILDKPTILDVTDEFLTRKTG